MSRERNEKEKSRKKRRSADIWRRLKKNKLAMLALVVIIIIVLVAIFADYIAPYDYDKQSLSEAFTYPCREHLLGTDNFGRDILSRIIYGGRISLLVAVAAVSFGLVVGGILGSVAAYFGGTVDAAIMRCLDVIMAIPGFLLAISISAALGSGVMNTAIAIGVGSVAPLARIVRGTAISITGQEYMEAARACGARNFRIIFTHLIPNSLSQFIVQGTLRIGESILQISSLSFIGLGVQPPTPEWGSMLANGREFIRSFWPIVTFPGVAIVITMIAFNLLGDGLRDALDPRLKQ